MTVSDDITFVILLRQAEFLYKKSTNLNNNPRIYSDYKEFKGYL